MRYFVDGDDLIKIKIISLPNFGILKLSNVPVLKNQKIDSSSIHNLQFHPNSQWFGSDQFTWLASDGNSFSNSSAKVLI